MLLYTTCQPATHLFDASPGIVSYKYVHTLEWKSSLKIHSYLCMHMHMYVDKLMYLLYQAGVRSCILCMTAIHHNMLVDKTP